MTKVRLHIDPRGVSKKPTENEWGRISKRVLESTSIKEVTVQQLAQKIEGGTYYLPRCAEWLKGRRLAGTTDFYGGHRQCRYREAPIISGTGIGNM